MFEITCVSCGKSKPITAFAVTCQTAKAMESFSRYAGRRVCTSCRSNKFPANYRPKKEAEETPLEEINRQVAARRLDDIAYMLSERGALLEEKNRARKRRITEKKTANIDLVDRLGVIREVCERRAAERAAA